jgi:phosphoribosyl 1,2-cyclic phosphodiesterase
VGTGQYGVLIDAGVSAKRIKTAMTDAGLDPAFIKAIFITHEHNDHISGINVLASQLKVPVYATPGTMAGLNDANILDGRFPTELLTDKPVVIGDMKISHFRTSHDSRQSCGYRIELPDRTVGVATDTGVATPEMMAGLTGCDLVLLESNYDDEMLMNGYYPPYLKARIRSNVGHLSNEASSDAACTLLDLNVRRFVLGHLSQHNNTPALALAAHRIAFTRYGAKENVDYEMLAAPVEAMASYMVF